MLLPITPNEPVKPYFPLQTNRPPKAITMILNTLKLLTKGGGFYALRESAVLRAKWLVADLRLRPITYS